MVRGDASKEFAAMLVLAVFCCRGDLHLKRAKLFRMCILRKKRIRPAGDDLRAPGEPRGSPGGALGELWGTPGGAPGSPGGAPGEPRELEPI